MNYVKNQDLNNSNNKILYTRKTICQSYQGKGTGSFHFVNSTKFLFTKDPLCNQNVSADW